MVQTYSSSSLKNLAEKTFERPLICQKKSNYLGS